MKKKTVKPKRSRAERVARKKRVFTFFNQLVRGAVKIWLNNTPYILPAEQVNDFIDQEIAAMK